MSCFMARLEEAKLNIKSFDSTPTNESDWETQKDNKDPEFNREHLRVMLINDISRIIEESGTLLKFPSTIPEWKTRASYINDMYDAVTWYAYHIFFDDKFIKENYDFIRVEIIPRIKELIG